MRRDTKQFLAQMMPRIQRAETALHNGDAGPRFELAPAVEDHAAPRRSDRRLRTGARPFAPHR
jgi:hypothetical protein